MLPFAQTCNMHFAAYFDIKFFQKSCHMDTLIYYLSHTHFIYPIIKTSRVSLIRCFQFIPIIQLLKKFSRFLGPHKFVTLHLIAPSDMLNTLIYVCCIQYTNIQ